MSAKPSSGVIIVTDDFDFRFDVGRSIWMNNLSAAMGLSESPLDVRILSLMLEREMWTLTAVGGGDSDISLMRLYGY